MDTAKILKLLAELGEQHAIILGLDNHPAIAEAAGAASERADGLAAEFLASDSIQFGPLVYSLRAIYSQLAATRAMVDVPRLVDWAAAVVQRIAREVDKGDGDLVSAAAAGAAVTDELYPINVGALVPEGAKQFVVFESLTRPGYRVACYSTGVGSELIGLDQKPRMAPAADKWACVAFFELPAALDLIPPAAMALSADEGSPDWYAEQPPAAAGFGDISAAPAPESGNPAVPVEEPKPQAGESSAADPSAAG